MQKVGALNYAVWQQCLFWGGWLVLFMPAYALWRGFSLVGSLVLNGYHDTVDWVLVIIMGSALLEILLIAVYTLRGFWCKTCSFKHLLLWLMLGAAGIPLAAALGCLFSYATLNGMPA